MNASELSNVLLLSASEVLEGMFYTSPLGDAPEDAPAGDISVALSFQGQPPGTFGLCTSPETGRKLAASFLGLDEESVTDEKNEEVLCELANMLCGSALSRIESNSIFALSQPKKEPAGSDRAAQPSVSRTFELEEGFLTTWIATENTP